MKTKALFPKPNKSRILVIGDTMLDRYIQGDTDRISPEAPVPVVHVQKTYEQAGGAGNVALNLASLECQTTLVGLVGKDRNAGKLAKILRDKSVHGILLETASPTITKVRVISKSQQLIRLDYEEKFELSSREEKTFIQTVDNLLDFHQLLILSDYAKGTLSASVCKRIISAGTAKGIPVIVDPKSRNWERYSGAMLITPNFREFCEVLNEDLPNTDDAIEKAGKKLLRQCGCSYMLVTRSEKGMSLITPKKVFHWKAQAREVFDVSGAGDTVIAVLSAAIASGLSIENAVTLANKAAGIVVGKSGTATITLKELNEPDK